MEKASHITRQWLALVAILLTIAILTGAGAARADVTRELPGYVHRGWTVLDGAPQNIVALAQGDDGFLWAGSAAGLSRFDGTSFETIPRIPGDLTRSVRVSALLVASNGDVWAGYDYGGLAIYRNGRLHDANHGDPHGRVDRIVEARNGAIYVSTFGRRPRELWRFQAGRWIELADDWGVPNIQITDLLAASDGSIWIISGHQIRVLRAGAKRFEVVATKFKDVAAIGEDQHGAIWAAANGAFDKVAQLPHSAMPENSRFHRSGSVIADRVGNLFQITDTGVAMLPIGAKAPILFDAKSGLTANTVQELFRDHEGDIWAGTTGGFDRFKPAVITPRPGPWQIAFNDNSSLLADRAGGVYVNDLKYLYRVDGLQGGRPVLTIKNPYWRYACNTQSGDILVADGDALKSLHTGRRIPVIFPKMITDHSTVGCAMDAERRIIVRTAHQGVIRSEGGVWRPLHFAHGGHSIWPWVFASDQQGRVLLNFAVDGVGRLDGDKFEWIGTRQAIGVGLVGAMMQSGQDLLLGGELGLARYRNGRFSLLRASTYPWLGNVTGMVQLPSGEVWLFGAKGLAHLPMAQLQEAFDKPGLSLRPKIYGYADGVPGPPQTYGNHDLTVDGTGRLWLLTVNGIASVDPAALAANRVPPHVMIRSLVTGHTDYRSPSNLRIAPGNSNLTIGFAALGLRSPEQIQVRYRLEGHEEWTDPGVRRQAFYTNLEPGTYRFQVIAANEDGVWNRAGATLTFTIEPSLTQTWLFWIVCGVAACLLAWTFFSIRLRQVARQERWRTEERLRERSRIARELHDTLLQAVQGLILRFQSAFDQMPDETRAKASLERTLIAADTVLDEARDKVTELRSPRQSEPLADQLAAMADQLFDESATRILFDIDGSERAIDPTVCDELAQIAREALVNIRQHAGASEVMIMLRYGIRQFQLRIQDNGTGVPPEILAREGRDGHYGLAGMRERAERIKAVFKLTSTASGTTVSIMMPARQAYAGKVRKGREAIR